MAVPHQNQGSSHDISADRDIDHASKTGGVTARSLVIAALLSLLAALWVRQSEIVAATTQVTESVPAIPGLAVLVLLPAINALLRRSKSIKPLTTAEMLTAFFFVCISSTIMGIGVTEYLLSILCTPFYSLNDPEITRRIPSLLALHNREVVRQLFEGADNGHVPWTAWMKPGVMWLGFFIALWSALYCMTALFFRVWTREEKLSFPLVMLYMEMTETRPEGRPFFRNGVMWLGFGMAGLYNLLNILHCFLPAMPPIPQQFDFTRFSPSTTPNALTSMTFFIRPELIGFGFLVQSDLSLTVWFSYLVLQVSSLIGVAYNMQNAPGSSEPFPYAQEQGLGGYLLVAAVITWKCRSALWSGLTAAMRRRDAEPRWPYVGLGLGLIGSWAFMAAAGMGWWVSGVYLAVILAIALVYSRIRAEAGVPLNWLFPYGMPRDFLFYAFGSHILSGVSASAPTTLTLFSFLSRGYFPESTGYQIEAMDSGRRVGLRTMPIAKAMLLALVAGVVLGWAFHISTFYQHGGLHKAGGMWGVQMAIDNYTQSTQFVPSNGRRTWATIAGAVIAFVLTVCRRHIIGFPIAPLGYVMACSYGSLLWGPFLIVWLAKSLILHYGGLPLYRRAIPFFLGLALGHFAVAGIIWGLAGACFGDVVNGYQVWFG